jgi:hypothetical protein
MATLTRFTPRREVSVAPEATLPFPFDAASSVRLAKLPRHEGVATILHHPARRAPRHEGLEQFRAALGCRPSSEYQFSATFFQPATGPAVIVLRGHEEARLSLNFGEGLTISGDSADGPFVLDCPEYYVRSVSPAREGPSWAVARPVNAPATIRYGAERPVARVTALINNFDFEGGNVPPEAGDWRRPNALRVQAGDRPVEFAWRECHDELRRAVLCGVFPGTALTTFSFDAWPGAKEEELTTFAHRVAWLCSIVSKQHTGVSLASFLDGQGKVVKRLVNDPVESPLRRASVIPHPELDRGLPQLFRECFEEHARLQGAALWGRLPCFCAAIEDSPYLEQKAATLMAALELLIRSALVEGGHYTQAEAERLTLPELVGAARKRLGWDMPRHYTRNERHRELRNAVAHGNELPFSPEAVRLDFDKWHLFLLRRFLIRLGFTGNVACPAAGWLAESPVGDFTEGRNSFEVP